MSSIRLSLRERFAARAMAEHLPGILQSGIDDDERSMRVKRAAVLSVQLGDEMARELMRELLPKPPPPGTMLPCRLCGENVIEWDSRLNTCKPCRKTLGYNYE